jgi:mRNA interferase RelE/StbE
MKKVVYTPRANNALRQHANRASLIMSKVRQYADDPTAQANNVKKLKGRPDFRLRVGDYRVVFSETEDTITVHDIGPRGGIYD